MLAESAIEPFDDRKVMRLKKGLIQIQRDEIIEAGPGPVAPQFNR